MKALNTRQAWAATIGLSLSWDANSIAVAQYVKDPPWNPDHIDHLPAEARSAVLATCQKPRSAGHYFATYSQTRDRLICTSRSSIASKVQPFATLPVAFTKRMR